MKTRLPDIEQAAIRIVDLLADNAHLDSDWLRAHLEWWGYEIQPATMPRLMTMLTDSGWLYRTDRVVNARRPTARGRALRVYVKQGIPA